MTFAIWFSVTEWRRQLLADEPTQSRIIDAFAKSADGYSSDEVLINDKLRAAFLTQLADEGELTEPQERDALLTLLKLRKAGKLTQRATKRGPRSEAGVSPIAEIAARVVVDRHRITTDTMLADRRLRDELQDEAEKIRPGVDAYAIRKSVLQLRKKRSLKPELVLRVADWKREILTRRISELRADLSTAKVPAQPGVYLFRSERGYLYVGEASNLATRLAEHLAGSDRELLAKYLATPEGKAATVELHVFPKDSPASKLSVRRAYESELIRSREPKFNSRP